MCVCVRGSRGVVRGLRGVCVCEGIPGCVEGAPGASRRFPPPCAGFAPARGDVRVSPPVNASPPPARLTTRGRTPPSLPGGRLAAFTHGMGPSRSPRARQEGVAVPGRPLLCVSPRTGPTVRTPGAGAASRVVNTGSTAPPFPAWREGARSLSIFSGCTQ